MGYPDELGKEIADVLGIKNCRKLTLDFEAGRFPLVLAEFFILEEEGKKIIPIIAKYKLVEKE